MSYISSNLLPLLSDLRVSFYLNTPNKQGNGVIYARYHLGGKRYRISTNIKVPSKYWDSSTGNFSLSSVTPTEWQLYTYYIQTLNNVCGEVEKLRINYLCTENSADAHEIGRTIGKVISVNLGKATNTGNRMAKKTTPKKITTLLHAVALEADKEKTRKSRENKVIKFGKFLKETGKADDVSTLTMATMREYRDWLENSNLTISTAKIYYGGIFSLAKEVEQKYDYDFGLDKGRTKPFKDNISREEKNEGYVILSNDEIALFENYKPKTERREIVRDMFLLQCYTGVRESDLKNLLNSKNLKQHDRLGVVSEFRTQKTNEPAQIPLQTLYPRAYDLVKKYLDKCPTLNNYYIDALKTIAKEVGLNRIIDRRKRENGKLVTVSKPAYEWITPHSGRHTFSSNCYRDFGISIDRITTMTGHTNTKTLTNTYINLTKDDKLNLLADAIQEAKTATQTTSEIQPKEESPLAKSDPNNDPVMFVKWLIWNLGLKIGNDLDLASVVSEIAKYKQKIIHEYGVAEYENIKTFLGLGLTEEGKQRLNLLFCKATDKQLKLRFTGLQMALKKLK